MKQSVIKINDKVIVGRRWHKERKAYAQQWAKAGDDDDDKET